MNNRLNIGHITSGRRDILNGDRYDHLFPKPNLNDRVVKRQGNVEDTIVLMKAVVWKYKDDTKKLAQILKRSIPEETCENIWNFLYNHVQYKKDKEGVEELRRPARSWHEKKSGIDCDCFSIFISSILTNLNIPHKFRVVRYDEDYFQHVYVVVPIHSDNNNTISAVKGYYTVDAVLSESNYEKSFTDKKDYDMDLTGIDIAVLDGTENDDMELLQDILFPENLEGFDSIGDISEEKREEAIYNYLLKTREYIAGNPSVITPYEDPKAFLEMLDYAIKYWHTDKRDEALRILVKNEDKINIAHGFTEPGLEATNGEYYSDGLDNTWDELDGMSNEEIEEYLDDLEEAQDIIEEELDEGDGLGELGKGKRKKRREKRKARRKKRKEKRKEKKAIKKKYGKGKARRKAIKDWRKKNKRGFFRSIGKGLKKGLKAVIRYNPATIAARNGFLLVLKLNMFHIAENLKWGYATEDQIKGKISEDKWKRSKEAVVKVEKIYVDRLQGRRRAIRLAILKGKSGGLNGVPDRYFSEGVYSNLGVAPLAVGVAAATPIITAVVKILKDAGILSKDVKPEDVAEQLRKLNEDVEKGTIPDEYIPTDEGEDEGGDDGKKGPWNWIKRNPFPVLGGLGLLSIGGYFLFRPKKKKAGEKTGSEKQLSGSGSSSKNKKNKGKDDDKMTCMNLK